MRATARGSMGRAMQSANSAAAMLDLRQTSGGVLTVRCARRRDPGMPAAARSALDNAEGCRDDDTNEITAGYARHELGVKLNHSPAIT